MPEYLAPGVYIEERDTGPKAIEGVSTTTSGMVGITERGPVGVPTLVIGSADFRRQFGGLLDRRVYVSDQHGDNWYLPHAVDGFFTNGGKRLYIVRVLPDSAPAAEAMLFDRGQAGLADTELAAAAQAGDTALLVTDNAGISAGNWLKLVDGNATEYVEVASTAAGAFSITGRFQFTHAAGSAITVVTPTPGAGDTLAANTVAGDQQITTTATFGAAATNILEIGSGATREYAIVLNAPGTTIDLAYRLSNPHSSGDPVRIVTLAAGAASTLANAAGADDRLFVASDGTIAGLSANAVVHFANPDEYQVVEPVGGVRFATPAAQLHGIGSQVRVVTAAAGTSHNLSAVAHAGSSSLTLDAVTGVTVGSFLQVGASPHQEFAEVQAVNAATRTVVLRDALALEHASGQAATVVTFTAVANSTTLLAARLSPGESLSLVEQPAGLAGYSAGALVELSGATAGQLEYRLVDDTPAIHAFVAGTPASGANPAVPSPIAAMHLSEIQLLGRNQLLTVQAIDPGQWGNSIEAIAEEDNPIVDTTAAQGNAGDPTLQLRTTVGVEPGTILEIGYIRNTTGPDTPGTLQKVASVTGNRVGFAGGLAVGVSNGARVRSREFKLTVQLVQTNPNTGKPRVTENEVHRHLSMDPRHTRYVTTVIGPIFRTDATTPRRADGRTQGESGLIRVEDILADPLTGQLSAAARATAETSLRLGPDLNTATLPDGRVVPVPSHLAGGDDLIGTVTDSTYIGVDDVNPESRTGLYALKNIPEISIVAVPGRTSQTVQQAVIDHCEFMKYRFGVLDAGRGEGMAEVQEHRSLYDTKYAAFYHPWLIIEDPFPDNPRVGGEVLIPPAGHMMGIYARSDIERGVHKAPANEVISGILDLSTVLHKEEQDILNPRNINVLRNFRESNRGLRVWGARTLSSDPDWKYINVRRLFIFIEHSIDNGTQWVVFEPNAEPLWQRVIRVVSSFLRGVWRDGALMGVKPEEAYYVKCDRSTMSQNDIDNGRLIVEVGIAPVKPAEFVIFRIGQWSGGSDVAEA